MNKMQEYEIRREYATIAAIIADNYMKSLYEVSGEGYIACLATIAATTDTIFKEYYPDETQPEDWEAVCHPVGCECWDDLIIKVAGELLSQSYPGLTLAA
jgi:hypothetical protein